MKGEQQRKSKGDVMKDKKIIIVLFTLIVMLSGAVVFQQIQIFSLQSRFDVVESGSGMRYSGNPFTTGLWSGQLQAENITGMHWYTYKGGSLFNRTDVLANPEQVASYIIFGDDTNGDGTVDVIFAKNGATGQIMYGGLGDAGGVDGSNASAVLQALANVSNEGDIWLIKNGLYNVDSFVTFASGVYIIGESWKTILNFSSVASYFRLYPSGGGNFTLKNIAVNGSGTWGVYVEAGGWSDVVIEHVLFDGIIQPVKIGNNGYDWRIEDNVFKSWSNPCVSIGKSQRIDILYNKFFDGTDDAVGIDGGSDITISYNFFKNCEDYVIKIKNQATRSTNNVKVSYNTFVWDANPSQITNAIVVSGEATQSTNVTDVIISDNLIISNNPYVNLNKAIYLHRYNATTPNTNININHVQIHNNIVVSFPIGLVVMGENMSICFNQFVNCTTPVTLATADYRDTDFSLNKGFVTENVVSFTNLANGSYVAHGLAGTPTHVTITLSNKGYGWYGAKNSTHVQLYFSTSTASGTTWFKYEP